MNADEVQEAKSFIRAHGLVIDTGPNSDDEVGLSPLGRHILWALISLARLEARERGEVA